MAADTNTAETETVDQNPVEKNGQDGTATKSSQPTAKRRATTKRQPIKKPPIKQPNQKKADNSKLAPASQLQTKYPRHSLDKALRIPKAILEQNAGKECSDSAVTCTLFFRPFGKLVSVGS